MRSPEELELLEQLYLESLFVGPDSFADVAQYAVGDRVAVRTLGSPSYHRGVVLGGRVNYNWGIKTLVAFGDHVREVWVGNLRLLR